MRLFRLPACTAALSALLVLSTVAPAAAGDRQAAIVRDMKSGEVLFARSADERRYPASLTKMMTLYVLFEEIEAGRLTLQSPLAVSVFASRQAPTKLGLEPGDTLKVEDAIKGLVTKSANDAAVVVAENLAGSEPAFAERMTRTAQTLGMTATRFRNASGLPHPDQFSTARDMTVLGAALQDHFPRQYSYFRTRTFDFRGKRITSHNKLVGRVEGVDGIKTGYIRASGFNVVTSIRRGGRSLVAVVMGGPTAKARDRQMQNLIATYLPKASSSASARAGIPKPQTVSAAE
jgi:D-alanyl-D-alanine carboxypeptidase